MKSAYLLINFFSAVVPFLFSYHPRIKFNKHFRSFFIANAVVAVVFLIWDSIFTNLGVWGFNGAYVLGLHLFHLPLEEILFFICIPFACVFTYYTIQLVWKVRWSELVENVIVLTTALSLLLLGLFNVEKLYTGITFISTSLVLLFLRYGARVDWLPQFFSTYLILLFPFFLVNGMLTGSALEEPIVWYNDSENLGIRLGTIPIEDVVYGLELLVLNVFLFELLRTRSQ